MAVTVGFEPSQKHRRKSGIVENSRILMLPKHPRCLLITMYCAHGA